MAEILGEFDREFPSPSAFCNRMSLEEYDRIGSEQTQNELQNLMQFLDSNPKQFYNAIRKRKRDELELLPFLKVKVMSAVKGDEYLNKCFPEEDCKKQLELWKDDLKNVYDLSQEASGSHRRFSKRLAAKKQIKESDHVNAVAVQPSPIPKPPPPPPIQTPNGLANCSFDYKIADNEPCVKSETVRINEDVFQSIRNISGRGSRIKTEEKNDRDKTIKRNEEDKREVQNEEDTASGKQEDTENIEPKEVKETEAKSKKSMKKTKSLLKKLSKNNLQNELANARKKLKSTGSQKSSPYELSKARRKRSAENTSFFNVALAKKFMKARSQTPSPSGSFNLSSSSFTDSPN